MPSSPIGRLRSFIKLCQGVLRSSSTLIIINHKCQARAAAFIERSIHLRLVDVDPGRIIELLSTLLFISHACVMSSIFDIDARAINYVRRVINDYIKKNKTVRKKK